MLLLTVVQAIKMIDQSSQVLPWTRSKLVTPEGADDRQVLPAQSKLVQLFEFSLLLIETISDSLNSNSADEIEEELADLQLLEYCQAALDQFRN